MQALMRAGHMMPGPKASSLGGAGKTGGDERSRGEPGQ
jgi:hypothetical protein